MKGSSSGTTTQAGHAVNQGSYKSKENNSGMFTAAASLRQRNTVYVPSASNVMLMGNSLTQNGNGIHKNSGSIGASHRVQSGNGKHAFVNGYVTQQLNAQEAGKNGSHNHSKSNGNMMGSALAEQPCHQTNQYPGHKQTLHQTIQNNNSANNLSAGGMQGPGSATSFHATGAGGAKVKLFK